MTQLYRGMGRNAKTSTQNKRPGISPGRSFLTASTYLLEGGAVGCAGIGVVVGCGVVLAGCTP
jgi:hypothetical protein